MLDRSRREILARLDPHELVLDVGGWAQPLPRADWVLDLMPYETRGLYEYDRAAAAAERFDAGTWVQRDICAREPWPFADGQFGFAICSQTLEDVRDPVWVCQELQRVARAGYIEVPSRLEEQTYGVQGPWVGWGHHHWLIDVSPGRVEFVFKHHVIHGRASDHFPAGWDVGLSPEERVQTLWWEGSFEASERIIVDAESLDAYVADFVREQLAHRPAPSRRVRWRRRVAGG